MPPSVLRVTAHAGEYHWDLDLLLEERDGLTILPSGNRPRPAMLEHYRDQAR